jgi:hypothetical protein
MAEIDRRSMLGILLGSGVAATLGVAVAPGPAESMPLPFGASRATLADTNVPAESMIEKAVVVVRRRPVRRRVCRWRAGRRVCTWR